MSLKDNVLQAITQNPETPLALELREGFKPDVAYRAIQYVETQNELTSRAWTGLVGGAAQIVVLGAISFVGIATLTDVFNSGKNLEYVKRNGFVILPKTGGGGYVIQFPDGLVIDPDDPNYKVDKELMESFKENMAGADGAMIRSQMTYYAQSIMVGLAGIIGPYLTVKGLAEVAYKSKLKFRKWPMEPLYFPSLLLSMAMTSAGFHFYGENLDGAEESIKQLTAYRKATGEDSYIDHIMSPWAKILTSKLLLAGVFTVGGGTAIRPYISLAMYKAGSLFASIYYLRSKNRLQQ